MGMCTHPAVRDGLLSSPYSSTDYRNASFQKKGSMLECSKNTVRKSKNLDNNKVPIARRYGFAYQEPVSDSAILFLS